jgi:hypothetical protein
MKWLGWIIAACFVYWYFFADRIRCDDYASKFSCRYLENDAQYDVFYWRRVWEDDPEDERLIATVTGLQSCKNAALAYSAQINEAWNERAYICVLKKDGAYLEKHRWLR